MSNLVLVCLTSAVLAVAYPEQIQEPMIPIVGATVFGALYDLITLFRGR